MGTLGNSLGNSLAHSLGFSLNGANGLAAPEADAGADASHDQVATPSYTLAGSATGGGSITYGWTKVSGPGSVSFADATSPTSGVTFQWPGTYVLRLTATNAGGSDTDDVTLTVTAPTASLLTLCGAKTQWLYAAGISSETLNGSNYSQLNDLGPSGYHASQGTAGNQPAKDATGGPLGDVCINMQDTSRRLVSTAVSVASGKNLFFIKVVKCLNGAGATRSVVSCRTGATEGSGDNVDYAGTTSANNFFSVARCSTGAETSSTFTSPAGDTSWHVWSKEYRTGLAPQETIDSTACTPDYATITGAANAIESLTVGVGALSGGRFKLWGCFDAPTAAQKTAIRQWTYGVTGIANG